MADQTSGLVQVELLCAVVVVVAYGCPALKHFLPYCPHPQPMPVPLMATLQVAENVISYGY
jgi:hypothetical protein